MGNLTLNIYKAFGIRKAKKTDSNDPLELLRLVEEGMKGNVVPASVLRPAKATDAGLYITRTGKRGGTKKHKSPRTAMAHAIKQMMESDSDGVFITHPITYGASAAMTKLYRHPKTGNLTLGHGSHENYSYEVGHLWNENTPQRDIQAFDKIKHLHKNSLLSLKSHGDIPMDIDTGGLTNLPEELHTTTKRVYPWSDDYFDPNYKPYE